MMPCSNMEMIIRKETNMNLHIDDGVQFGLGAFETIAVEKNKPVFLERHLQRLQHRQSALMQYSPRKRI